jgi:hypothetical protein
LRSQFKACSLATMKGVRSSCGKARQHSLQQKNQGSFSCPQIRQMVSVLFMLD